MPPTRPEIDLVVSQAPSLGRRFAASLRFQTVLLAVLLATSAVVFAVEFRIFGPDTARYRDAMRAVRLVHAGMLDQETGIRGFLLTNDRKFLQPHVAGTQQMNANNVHLDELLAGDRLFGPQLLEFRVAQRTWSTNWAALAIGDPDRVSVAAGKDLFDAYRASEAPLELALDRELTSIVYRRRVLLGAAAALQLLFFGVALTGGHRRLRGLRQTTMPAVGAILAAIHRVRDGHLEPVNRQPSSSEFDEIQAGLDEMIQAIARERGKVEAHVRDTEAMSGDLRQMLATAREFSGTLNLKYVLRALGKSACALTRQPRAAIWLVDDASHRLDPAHDTAGPQGAPAGLESLEIGAGLVGRAARYARTMLPGSSSMLGETDGSDQLPGEIAVPLIVGARVVGVVQLSGGTAASPGQDTLEMLEILASHAASAIEAARLHQSTEEQSQRDALTHLYNRRRLNRDLDEEVRRSRRYRRPLSFIMLDVDHFKRLNDSQGHAKGDAILQELGRLLQETVRDTDTAYRYGGEEFTILVRETGLDGTRELAERLRGRIEEHFAHANGEPPITASLGVATFSERMVSATDLIQAADRSLYEAKRAGRNRVVVASAARVETAS